MKYILKKSAVLSFVSLKIIVFSALIFLVTGCLNNSEDAYVDEMLEILCRDLGANGHFIDLQRNGGRLDYVSHPNADRCRDLTLDDDSETEWEVGHHQMGFTSASKITPHLEIYDRIRNLDIPNQKFYGIHRELELAYADWITSARGFRDSALWLEIGVMRNDEPDNPEFFPNKLDAIPTNFIYRVGIKCKLTHESRGTVALTNEKALFHYQTEPTDWLFDDRNNQIDSDPYYPTDRYDWEVREGIEAMFKDPEAKKRAIYRLDQAKEKCSDMLIHYEKLHVATSIFLQLTMSDIDEYPRYFEAEQRINVSGSNTSIKDANEARMDYGDQLKQD